MFLGGIIIILGVLILYGGSKCFIRLKNVADKMNSICCAKVISSEIWDYTNDHGYKTTYEAIVNEKHIIFKDKIASNFKKRIGKTVKIKYDSKNPENFSLVHKDSRFMFPIVAMFIGAVVVFIGITMLISVV